MGQGPKKALDKFGCPETSAGPKSLFADVAGNSRNRLPKSVFQSPQKELILGLVQFRAHRDSKEVILEVILFISITSGRTAMRRWDRLLDSYVEEYRARGVSPQSIAYTEARLNRWGRWLKGRRPRIGTERIDAEIVTRYISVRGYLQNSLQCSEWTDGTDT